MNYRAIFFDFDGTLVPSLPLWRRGFKVTFASYGIELSDDQIVKRCFYRPTEEVVAEYGFPSVEDYSNRLMGGLRESFEVAELFPTSKPLIHHCREHGLRVALVTSAPRYILNDVMPRLGMEELFDFVVAADDVEKHKPHPDALYKALEALGCKPAEAVMVGDSTADILGGHAAGTATALFLPDDHTAFYCFDTLRATNPTYVFDHHADLPGMMGLPPMQRER